MNVGRNGHPMDLFDHSDSRAKDAPLANRMRPRSLAEVVGQEHLLGEGRMLGAAIAGDQVSSMVLWGTIYVLFGLILSPDIRS